MFAESCVRYTSSQIAACGRPPKDKIPRFVDPSNSSRVWIECVFRNGSSWLAA